MSEAKRLPRRERVARCRPAGRAPGAVPRSRLRRGGEKALRRASRSEPPARRTRVAFSRARPRAGERSRRADRRATVRPRQRRRLRDPRGRLGRRRRWRAEADRAQPRGDRLRPCAQNRSEARHRHHHRHRRRGAARRRRRGDDRAHRADREHSGNRAAPRRNAGAVHLLRRLRHCARRDSDAQGSGDRLARDRHAGGLRVGLDRRGAATEGRGALDRRRAGRARRYASARRRL